MTHYRKIPEFIERSLRNPSPRVREALKKRRVIMVRSGEKSLYLFKSRGRDYILIPGIACSCRDFEINVVFRGVRGACYHLVAAELALKEGGVRVLDVDEEAFERIFDEVLYEGKSLTLRKELARDEGIQENI